MTPDDTRFPELTTRLHLDAEEAQIVKWALQRYERHMRRRAFEDHIDMSPWFRDANTAMSLHCRVGALLERMDEREEARV